MCVMHAHTRVYVCMYTCVYVYVCSEETEKLNSKQERHPVGKLVLQRIP